MTSFKFPPPPPPPPKASNAAQPSYQGQRGGPNQGRGGDRGRGDDRGRGGDRGRGRGGHGRGGNNSGSSSGNTHAGRGSRGGNSYGGNQQTPRQPATSSAQGDQSQAQMNPQAFAQAMSFMSTPAGMQSMAAFATHMSSMTSNSQNPQSPPPAQPQAPRYSPGQHAGQKRKRPEHNAHAPPLPPKKPQTGPKPPRAKAAPPPPVPSFGFSLPTPALKANSSGSKKRVNLGLSAQNVMDESSEEEEDVDEEAAFAEKVKVEGVAFEHNGEMISLQTAADVQAYIKDRRRNFPTQQRIAEKIEQAAAKREHELEFLYRVKGKRRPVVESKPVKAEKLQRKPEVDVKKQEELAALRKRLHESMLSRQTQAPANLLGVEYDSDTGSDDESSILSESSVVSSSSEDSSDDDDDDFEEVEQPKQLNTHNDNNNDSDSDTPPTPISSKLAPQPIAIPPPPPAPTVSLPTHQICRNWVQYGRCKWGKGCKWAHPVEERGSSKKEKDRESGRKGDGEEKKKERIGLFEKMVQQELEKRDVLVVEAVKYLGENGFLG